MANVTDVQALLRTHLSTVTSKSLAALSVRVNSTLLHGNNNNM